MPYYTILHLNIIYIFLNAFLKLTFLGKKLNLYDMKGKSTQELEETKWFS